MRVLFCGDRNWVCAKPIRDQLKKLPKGTIIIEGEARGADSIARFEAEGLGFKVLRFPADWATYGRSAGPIRNTEMLKTGKPDLVLAFHDDIENSKGTAHMVKIALRSGVETRVINSKGVVTFMYKKETK